MPQPQYVGVDVTVTEDQFRLYYAAYYGNVEIMEALKMIGWHIDG